MSDVKSSVSNKMYCFCNRLRHSTGKEQWQGANATSDRLLRVTLHIIVAFSSFLLSTAGSTPMHFWEHVFYRVTATCFNVPLHVLRSVLSLILDGTRCRHTIQTNTLRHSAPQCTSVHNLGVVVHCVYAQK